MITRNATENAAIIAFSEEKVRGKKFILAVMGWDEKNVVVVMDEKINFKFFEVTYTNVPFFREVIGRVETWKTSSNIHMLFLYPSSEFTYVKSFILAINRGACANVRCNNI